MATEIRVPTLGESVSEATVGTWFKKVGDAIKADEPLLELETDKVTIEVPAPAAGTQPGHHGVHDLVLQRGDCRIGWVRRRVRRRRLARCGCARHRLRHARPAYLGRRDDLQAR